MKIAVIGSGLSGLVTSKILLEKNFDVTLISCQYKGVKKIDNFRTISKLKNKSFKYEDQNFIQSNNIFKKINNIELNNFFLSSVLADGGLSNFWGAGLEIPDDNYLKKLNYSFNINRGYKFLNSLFHMDQNKIPSVHDYYNDKIIKNLFSNNNLNIYFSQLKLAFKKNYSENKLNDKSIFEYKDILNLLLSKKNFNFKNLNFVTNIEKNNKKYNLVTKSTTDQGIDKLLDFDKIFICAGTIGSTILFNNILRLKNLSSKLYHHPMLKLAYFKINNSNISNNFNYPLLNINIKNSDQNIDKGSIIFLKDVENKIFGLKNSNKIFHNLKKYFVAGNLFLPSDLITTQITFLNKKIVIDSKLSPNFFEYKKRTKKKLNTFFGQMNYLPLPFQNMQLMEVGSDSHYTSTLHNMNNFFNDKYELKEFPNVYFMDGSIIPPNLNFPTAFILMNIDQTLDRIFNI